MTIKPIEQWIAMLATLVNPAFAGEAVEALRPMIPHLTEDFPPNHFTAMSARCVARAERFGPVPDFAVISKALVAYRETFIPKQFQALTAPRAEPPAPPTPEQQQRVGDILRAFLAGRPVPVEPPSHKLPDVSLSGATLQQAWAAADRVRPDNTA